MIKKALISAAGRGSRMLDLSADKPKHLIEVNGRPFLYYLLNNLKKAGFLEVVMVLGYKKELIESFLYRHRDDFQVEVINQFDVLGDKKYGTACPLECVTKLLGQENFLSVYGDNLYSVEDLQAFNIDDDYHYVAGLKHENPQNYGVLHTDQDNFLQEIIEKPKEFVGDMINTGLYKFTPEVFDYLDKISQSVRGEYELTDVINLLAKQKKVKTLGLKNIWFDFGKPSDIQKVEEYVKQKYD